MNLFEYALKMELDGEQYYSNLAEQAQYEDLKKVFRSLAEDEQRHYKIILAVQNETADKLKENPLFNTVQNVFAMNVKPSKDNPELIARLKNEQIDVYRAALEKEKESVALYSKLRGELTGQAEIAICTSLMQEEEKHVEVIDNLIDMLNHVNDWVESAEFNHQDVY